MAVKAPLHMDLPKRLSAEVTTAAAGSSGSADDCIQPVYVASSSSTTLPPARKPSAVVFAPTRSQALAVVSQS